MEDLDQAELDRKVAAFKERLTAEVESTKQQLQLWIDKNNDLSPHISDPAFSRHSVEISIALLEMGIDRYIELHGDRCA